MGSVDYRDVDDLAIGSVSGTLGITTGNGATNGGDVTINAGGLLSVNQKVDTSAGSGGALSIGSGVTISAPLVVGAGNITLNGGGPALDIIINADLNIAANTTLTALRDILIRANLTTTAGYSLSLTAGNTRSGDGAGGVWVDITTGPLVGQVHSGATLTVSGKDLFAVSATNQDAIRLDGVVTAAGTIDLSTGGSAPLGAGTYLNTTASATAGDILLHNPVTLSGSSTVSDTASGTIRFSSTVNGAGSALQTLAVNTAGTTEFLGAVGNTASLLGLTTDAAGTTDVNGSPVNATTVNYQDDVVLTINVTINATTVTFGKTVNADLAANNRTLTVNAGGVTSFNGAVGNSQTLLSLATDGPGSTHINGGSVATSGNQTYGDPVLLNASANSTTAGRAWTSVLRGPCGARPTAKRA